MKVVATLGGEIAGMGLDIGACLNLQHGTI